MTTTCSQIFGKACRVSFPSKPGGWRPALRCAAFSALLLAGGLPTARAVDDFPGEITGKIKWTNSPGSPVGQFLSSGAPPHGFGSWSVAAYNQAVGYTYLSASSSGGYPGAFLDTRMSQTYLIIVQAQPFSGGAVQKVGATAHLGDGNTYHFLSQDTANPVPFLGQETLDFCECAGLLHINFCDQGGQPYSVNSQVNAYVVGTGERQAYGHALGTQKSLVVRGGETYQLTVSVTTSFGSDPFNDLISYGTTFTTNVFVGCGQVVSNFNFCVSTNTGPPPDTNSYGRIIGRVDMLTESEHYVFHGRTLMVADGGPFGNYRYAQPPPVVAPSEGTYVLPNLLPTVSGYRVHGGLIYGFGRRAQSFLTPQREGGNNQRVPVPFGATVNLGDTFVMDPGWRVGDVFLCGPNEKEGESNSCLRRIIRDSDPGYVDGNNIPYSYSLPRSYVRAAGIDTLAPGASLTAYAGDARTLFEGDYMDSGVKKGSFSGDYRLTIGGLLQEPTVWHPYNLRLVFAHSDSPLTPAGYPEYLNCNADIANHAYLNEVVTPGVTKTNNHRYGFSCVTINFHAFAGTLYAPSVSGSGVFDSNVDGPDFEGKSALYYVSASGSGTPISYADRLADGTVNLAVPQGRYTFNAGSQVVNAAGLGSANNLPPITLAVGPCQKICICPGLQMTMTNLPMCATNRLLHVTGFTHSDTNVVSMSYELNGSLVNLCNGCGVSPSFAFDILLDDCENILKVTAVGADGCVACVESTIRFDLTPPVLSGCTDIYTNSIPGTNGNFVSYSVTAVDNCDGVVDVLCTPPSGTFFPVGKTIVTCLTVDSCKNTNTCEFTVGIDTCVAIGDERIECDDYHAWTYTFRLTNCFPGPLSYIVIPEIFTPGVTLAGSPYTYLPVPLQPGESADITFSFSSSTNLPPPTNLCFLISVHNDNFDLCCSKVHCVTLPNCCLKVEDPLVTCVTNSAGIYNYTFTAQNLTEQSVHYLLVVPLPPVCFDVSPAIKFLNPALAPGDSASVSLTFSNVSPDCGSNLCFLISVHDASFNECCGFTNCIPNPALPQLNCPSNIVAECAGPQGTPVTYAATASGSCFSSNVTLVCSPPSGFPFPVGANMVKCHAWDNRGYTNWCTFTVTIRDTLPPEIDCPPDVFAECAGAGGTRVAFSVTASDLCDSNVIVLCRPPSNSLFPLGATTVRCRAIDDCGNTNACSFTVTVRDTLPPWLASATADCQSNKITVTFNEPLDAVTAGDAANYQISFDNPPAGVPITIAVVSQDPSVVCLYPGLGLQSGILYTLTVTGVRDTCGLLIATNSQITFQCPSNPPPVPLILAPAVAGGMVSFSMQTEDGVPCNVEYTESLSPADWKLLKIVVGDGSMMTVTDSPTNATQRFYRIRME